MPIEISKIKPPIEGNEIQTPKFTHSTEEYDSYEKEGFEPPQEWQRHDWQQRRFLSEVDVTKGKILVTVKTIIRQKALDETGHSKDYLTYNTEWQGKNPFSEDLYIREHIEGCHWIQTKKIQRGFNPETGHPTAHYEKGQPKLVYTIPFSNENVNKILNDKHLFGEDSENISEIALVQFY